MRIIDEGVVFRGERGTDWQSCAFPGLCVLPDGRWLATCRGAPTKGGTTGQHVRVTWSDDQGRTWSEVRTPFEPAQVEGKPGLFRAMHVTALGGEEVLGCLYWVDHSNPELPFFNEKTEGLLDSRLFLSFSEDRGETWSAPELVDTSPFHQPTPITGPVLVLPSGEWALQFELNKHYDDPGVWRHSSVMMFSADRGCTWPRWAITSNDPENRIFYWDQRPAVLDDGTILTLFWTYDNQTATYLNIHARRSQDEGRTWSGLWDTGVGGQPAPPVSLPDGRIAMVYVDRSHEPCIKMRVSSDGGASWPEETEFTIHAPALENQTLKKGSMQDAWTEMGRFSLGLPITSPLQGGDILVLFYSGPETDWTDVRWARVGL